MREEQCACGHPGLTHHFLDKNCLVADCACSAFACKAKAHKYHADPVCTCGHQKSRHNSPGLPSCNQCWACTEYQKDYDSTAEWRRGEQLKLLERAGEILSLVRQPVYRLHVNGIEVGKYTPDFAYRRVSDGAEVVEDVKSRPTRTRLYLRSKKMVKAEYGIDIIEVGA